MDARKGSLNILEVHPIFATNPHFAKSSSDFLSKP